MIIIFLRIIYIYEWFIATKHLNQQYQDKYCKLTNSLLQHLDPEACSMRIYSHD